jgi:hypothetical protein
MVTIMNLLAGILSVGLLYDYFFSDRSLGLCSLFLILAWFLINLLNWIPWYPGKKGKVGIKLHLQKNLVPSSYLLSLGFSLKYLTGVEWYLLPIALLMLPILYVSSILVIFHFGDPSTLDPGYFSHNYYLNEETS